jgi:hypothetical protein
MLPEIYETDAEHNSPDKLTYNLSTKGKSGKKSKTEKQKQQEEADMKKAKNYRQVLLSFVECYDDLKSENQSSRASSSRFVKPFKRVMLNINLTQVNRVIAKDIKLRMVQREQELMDKKNKTEMDFDESSVDLARKSFDGKTMDSSNVGGLDSDLGHDQDSSSGHESAHSASKTGSASKILDSKRGS